jgi:hypothetical protein
MPLKDPNKRKRYHKIYSQTHREKLRQQGKKYYLNHIKECRERAQQCSKKRHLREKIAVFNHYGKKCNCCGEEGVEFLSIDHINNDGAKHKRENGIKRWDFYHWLIKNNFPEGFQTLCMNCNFAKGKLGYCPHKKRGL